MRIPEVIIITGATATGKTALAVDLATYLQTDVISCDSQLVYQGLNIGSAKPSIQEMAGIPHYGMDLVPPTTVFSAAMYQSAVLPLILERLARKQPIILAGGTGFYLRQLFEPRTLVNVPPDPVLRQQLIAWARATTTEAQPYPLHNRLAQQDGVRASQLCPQDTQRILRALEIVETTGQPVPQLKTPCAVEEILGYMPTVRWVGLVHNDVSARWHRIKTRVDSMVEAGWLDEVATLKTTYGEDAHALHVAHGYPELLRVLKGFQTLEQAKERITFQVRQYARRQKKWFDRVEGLEWIDVSEGLPKVKKLLQ